MRVGRDARKDAVMTQCHTKRMLELYYSAKISWIGSLQKRWSLDSRSHSEEFLSLSSLSFTASVVDLLIGIRNVGTELEVFVVHFADAFAATARQIKIKMLLSL